MKRGVGVVGLVLAMSLGSVTTLLAGPAVAADRTATWTFSGGGASWTWYQGSTVISTSYANGTSGTTIQPGTADSIVIELSAGAGCNKYGGGSFAPGSAINFTVKIGPSDCQGTYGQHKAKFNISS